MLVLSPRNASVKPMDEVDIFDDVDNFDAVDILYVIYVDTVDGMGTFDCVNSVDGMGFKKKKRFSGCCWLLFRPSFSFKPSFCPVTLCGVGQSLLHEDHSLTSHVQIRGSIPVLWSSPTNLRYHPKVRIDPDEEASLRALRCECAGCARNTCRVVHGRGLANFHEMWW